MKLKFVIDKEYDKKMAKAFGSSKETLAKIDLLYKKKFYLESTKELYQKSWNEINDQFSKYIERVTGYKWFYPEYICVISVIHNGISNWGTAPIIVRSWTENPYYMRRITAHELIISHYFEIYKRHYQKEGLKKDQVWILAEIAAFALTSLTPESKDFWPWDTEYYTNHNYPQIVEIQNKLKNTFIKRKNFDEYIKKGINFVKKDSNMLTKG